MTTNPVTDTFGHVIGYLFVATDITDTRRSQEILVKALRREREVVARLKDLDRAKDDFVSTVSHELRTPMSSIIGSAEMLGEGVLGDLLPEQQRMVNVISRNGDRLLALADDLLVLATFDHDSWQDLDSQIDLRAVVQESEHAVAAMLATRRLDVTYEMPPDPVMVNGDATHLERAVTNLLSNAVKFTLDEGSIAVRLEVDSGTALGGPQRVRHRARHRGVRPRGRLRPLLPHGGGAGARHPGLRTRPGDREDHRGEPRGPDRRTLRTRRGHHVHDHAAAQPHAVTTCGQRKRERPRQPRLIHRGERMESTSRVASSSGRARRPSTSCASRWK